MILLKSLIVILLMLIIAQLVKHFWSKKQEPFEGFELQSIAPNENIADELESQTTVQKPILSASQKAQASAHLQKAAEDDATIADHKSILNNSLDMSKLKKQVDELLKLGNEAKSINESFKNKH